MKKALIAVCLLMSLTSAQLMPAQSSMNVAAVELVGRLLTAAQNTAAPDDQTMTLEEGLLNTLTVGQTAQVTLSANPTTGFIWRCIIGDETVAVLKNVQYTAPEDPALAGVGGAFTWRFETLVPGETTLTFHYCRDWEEDFIETPGNTIVYYLVVTE